MFSFSEALVEGAVSKYARLAFTCCTGSSCRAPELLRNADRIFALSDPVLPGSLAFRGVVAYIGPGARTIVAYCVLTPTGAEGGVAGSGFSLRFLNDINIMEARWRTLEGVKSGSA